MPKSLELSYLEAIANAVISGGPNIKGMLFCQVFEPDDKGVTKRPYVGFFRNVGPEMVLEVVAALRKMDAIRAADEEEAVTTTPVATVVGASNPNPAHCPEAPCCLPVGHDGSHMDVDGRPWNTPPG